MISGNLSIILIQWAFVVTEYDKYNGYFILNWGRQSSLEIWIQIAAFHDLDHELYLDMLHDSVGRQIYKTSNRETSACLSISLDDVTNQ